MKAKQNKCLRTHGVQGSPATFNMGGSVLLFEGMKVRASILNCKQKKEPSKGKADVMGKLIL